jgi:DNA-binding transcriptional LysR family regulator
VTLFDRSARYPTLTEEGRALLQNARAVADQMDGLRAGFGFGNMPRFMVEDELANGKLCCVRIEMPSYLKLLIPMRAVYRNETPPGPAGRWLIQHLKGRSQARRKN